MKLSGDNLFQPTKCFLKTSNLHLMIIRIIWMHGFVFSFSDPLIIPGSPTKIIRFKLSFQISFKNGGYSLAPSLKSFVLKSNIFMIILKSVLRVWSLLIFLKLFSLLLIFNSHGFYVGTLSKHIYSKVFFLHIWQRNSRSNGGQTSLLLLFNNFLI